MSQIQKARRKAGLTQVQLAKRLKVSVITVQKWEQGMRTPRTGRLRALARVLKVSVARLV